MSLQFGSSILKASAQDRYDTYLSAAIQADIQTHKDAFSRQAKCQALSCPVLVSAVSVLRTFLNLQPTGYTRTCGGRGLHGTPFKSQVKTSRTRLGVWQIAFPKTRVCYSRVPHSNCIRIMTSKRIRQV